MKPGGYACYLKCQGEPDFLALVHAERFEERCRGIDHNGRLMIGSLLFCSLSLDPPKAVPKRHHKDKHGDKDHQLSHLFPLLRQASVTELLTTLVGKSFTFHCSALQEKERP